MTAIKKQAEDVSRDDTKHAREINEAYIRGKVDMYNQMMRVYEEQRPGR